MNKNNLGQYVILTTIVVSATFFLQCSTESPRLLKEIVGTNGIKYEDDLVWVTDLFGQSISAFEAETGIVRQQFDFGDLGASPDDLVFMDDKSIIWTAPPQGMVGKITPNGDIVSLGVVGESVNPIERRPNTDDVYIGYESGNTKIGKLNIITGSVEVVVDELPSLNGFSFASDGFLYAPIFDLGGLLSGGGGILKIDVDNGTWAPLDVSFPDNPNKATFMGTTATVSDLNGNLYVLESLSPSVYKVNLATNETIKLGSIPVLATDNIAIDDQNNIYVTTFIQDEVYVFDEEGTRRRILIRSK